MAVKDLLRIGRSLAAGQTSLLIALCSVSHIGGHFTGQHAGLDTAIYVPLAVASCSRVCLPLFRTLRSSVVCPSYRSS